MFVAQKNEQMLKTFITLHCEEKRRKIEENDLNVDHILVITFTVHRPK